MSITASHISFSYGSHRVLDDLNFHIPDGSLVSVLGPNGVGKSTLFRCILGLERHYHGDISVDGIAIDTIPIKQRARLISYIPQNHRPAFQFRVEDVVLMSTEAHLSRFQVPGKQERLRAAQALERVGISHLAPCSYVEISGGEQQLVLIARALAQQAKTIVMDEPTSALDFGNTTRVLSCIRDLASNGYCIVQSTHHPDQAFLYSDYTMVIKGGRLFRFGKPQDVITREVIYALYGIEVEVASLCGDEVRVCVPSHIVNTKHKGRNYGHTTCS